MVNEPKKRSITGKLVANVLTEREDDFTCNVTYVANRSIKDLCRIRAAKGSKYTAAEYESMCNPVSKTVLKEVRRNRFPYKLRVGEDEERPGEL